MAKRITQKPASVAIEGAKDLDVQATIANALPNPAAPAVPVFASGVPESVIEALDKFLAPFVVEWEKAARRVSAGFDKDCIALMGAAAINGRFTPRMAWERFGTKLTEGLSFVSQRKTKATGVCDGLESGLLSLRDLRNARGQWASVQTVYALYRERFNKAEELKKAEQAARDIAAGNTPDPKAALGAKYTHDDVYKAGLALLGTVKGLKSKTDGLVGAEDIALVCSEFLQALEAKLGVMATKHNVQKATAK